MAVLSEVSETVQQVADAIAAVINVDVEINGVDLVRVAGTGEARKKIGKRLDYGVLNRHAHDTKEPIIVTEPGRHKYCEPCALYNNCFYYASIIYPIIYQSSCLGSFSLITFGNEQEKNLLEHQERLLDFLKRMADLISSKIAEKQLLDQVSVVSSELQAIINSVDRGIIGIDVSGIITNVNPMAQELLRPLSVQLLGESIYTIYPSSLLRRVLETGKGFAGKEDHFEVSKRRVRLISSTQPIITNGRVVGAVIIIQDIQSMGKLIHTLTGQGDYSIENILGKSFAITELKEQVKKVARSDSTALIRGESGTGKELFARAIHSESQRSNAPFVAINCAAIPENLLESELFGFEEGSFTGAKKGGKVGKFELAHKGTIFLDEIGDLPLHLQAKLLRVLEEKYFERIGGVSQIKMGARIIAATNSDLETAVQRGEFRRDLYFRLNVIPFFVPPLRERVEDIDVLIKHFLEHYNLILNKSVQGFSKEAEIVLFNYLWPGNVRELQNTIEYCVHMVDGPYIEMSHLPYRIKTDLKSKNSTSKIKPLDEMEKELIVRALDHFGTSLEGKKNTAKALGIGLTTLYRKGKKYNIEYFSE